MKKSAVLLVTAAFFTVVFAQESQDIKPELKLYGFVKGDMYYAIGGVQSWGHPAITCASKATGEETNATGFTAQHSRFGLKGSGQVGNVTMGGVIELDFFVVAANANAKPRMRLAYAWCKPVKGLEIQAGQQWDLFSPLNPSTNNTNANLWYDGNYGFRRPQLRLQYGLDLGSVMPIIQISAGETTKEDELAFVYDTTAKQIGAKSWLGPDNLSQIPLIQGRLALAFLKKMEIGVATVYGTYGEDRDVSTFGVSVDANLPFHNLFELKAEYAYGSNLNNANIFTIGGGAAKKGDDDVITNGFWVQAMTKPCNFFNFVLGFGDEMVTSDVADDKPESNMTLYTDFIFPIGKYFSLALEYQLLRTQIAGLDDAHVGHIIDFAGKVSF
ncbi:MAG: hypothetical protein JW863_10550 [Chitinispirillaceae bacterium]|nr:hypothetical protein [Chitinispirillaceae bacterium]